MKAELTEAELMEWGKRIGATAQTPIVISLRGDLGAGKTTLARAIGRGAGVTGPIPSPTYNLLFRYPTPDGREIVHVDLYRIEDEDEVWELGWAELPGAGEIVLIEWGERAESLLPVPRWEISLDDEGRSESRLAVVDSVGEPLPLEFPASASR